MQSDIPREIFSKTGGSRSEPSEAEQAFKEPLAKSAPGEDLPADHLLAGCRAIWHPEAPRTGPVWCLFRRKLELGSAVSPSLLWFSASQRCRIWLDGELLAEGPPRSDRETWPYVAVALPRLPAGGHVMAAEVVHYGAGAGKGQIGGKGFFLMATDAQALQTWRTDDPGWRCLHDSSRALWAGQPPEPGQPRLKGHRAIGLGQQVDFSKHPDGWQRCDFDAAGWPSPRRLPEPHNNPWGNRSLGCHLVATRIPAMRRSVREWARLIDDGLRPISLPLALPEKSRLRMVADAGCVITAFPELAWRDGTDARVRLTSCEAPYDRATGDRRDREDIAYAFLPGQEDELLLADSGNWSPEWFRSFRYLVLDIETGEQAFVLERLQAVQSGFPLEYSLSMSINDGRPWQRLIAVNRNTMAACSHETFFDAPSWEQAQFPGDARIMARHHYIACNDDRLPSKAIADCAASRTPCGLLRSHWPSSFEQVISTYSLQWIGMLHDHWWYRGEPGALRPHLPVARGILQWFLDRQRPDGLLGRIDEAPFVEWAFPAGCPEQGHDGGSSLLTAMLAEACAMLAALEPVAGYPELAPRWSKAAQCLRNALEHCWDAGRGLLRDHPEGGFSVHAQVQAALAGFRDDATSGAIMERALADPDCRQPASLYYRAHLAEALRRVGRADLVLTLFDAWFRMLEAGATTWPETDDPNSRSDCHGWGCMVETEIVHSLFGLKPAEPGWRRIRFAPYTAMPVDCRLKILLPCGEVEVWRSAQDGDWRIQAPVGITASFQNISGK